MIHNNEMIYNKLLLKPNFYVNKSSIDAIYTNINDAYGNSGYHIHICIIISGLEKTIDSKYIKHADGTHTDSEVREETAKKYLDDYMLKVENDTKNHNPQVHI